MIVVLCISNCTKSVTPNSISVGPIQMFLIWTWWRVIRRASCVLFLENWNLTEQHNTFQSHNTKPQRQSSKPHQQTTAKNNRIRNLTQFVWTCMSWFLRTLTLLTISIPHSWFSCNDSVLVCACFCAFVCASVCLQLSLPVWPRPPTKGPKCPAVFGILYSKGMLPLIGKYLTTESQKQHMWAIFGPTDFGCWSYRLTHVRRSVRSSVSPELFSITGHMIFPKLGMKL